MFSSFPYDAEVAVVEKDYFIPTAVEIPDLMLSHMVTPNPYTPGGFKGAGEPGTVGSPAVLANVVEDALKPLWVKIRKVPLSPAYLWPLTP